VSPHSINLIGAHNMPAQICEQFSDFGKNAFFLMGFQKGGLNPTLKPYIYMRPERVVTRPPFSNLLILGPIPTFRFA